MKVPDGYEERSWSGALCRVDTDLESRTQERQEVPQGGQGGRESDRR